MFTRLMLGLTSKFFSNPSAHNTMHAHVTHVVHDHMQFDYHLVTVVINKW